MNQKDAENLKLALEISLRKRPYKVELQRCMEDEALPVEPDEWGVVIY